MHLKAIVALWFGLVQNALFHHKAQSFCHDFCNFTLSLMVPELAT
jgi:hypothetical protein